ncbi:MAG TPA: class I SAM-dependent methyltransferase, partial [Gammaproteobacteria bacterium]|nr:class I SAM-dependent methyltransferase [Gammaproteobacteria bacterium]
MAINNAKLETFLGQIVGDVAAAMSGVMVNVGHKLGLYQAMVDTGPMTSTELADKTGTNERYVREWLNNQAAGGYITYDSSQRTFELPEEQALVLANSEGPAFLPPVFDVVASMYLDEDKIVDAVRMGKGIGWREHHHRLFFGTEAFFRSGYKANLTTNWIPALDGIETKLKAGAKVADIGCGHGASTVIMAKSYPESTFVGFDYHGKSIATARERAEQARLTGRVTFQQASAKGYSGKDYDLICFMDCLHDMGDPVGAAKHARQALAEGGVVMLVEPYTNDDIEENFNPVGRQYYAASTAICT